MLPDKLYGVTVSVSLAASVIQAFAITLQRRSHIFNDAEPPELQRSAFRRPIWVAGFLMYTIANIIGSIFTISYLPIVVLAPIGAMNLVFNAIFAKVMLGDPFTKRTAYGK
jgi:drug/metabolite transporter (DMT)-like permease